ncbi:MAG: polysaccharide pyruvyl transferase family protein [Lachnospiraceae bacterium]|jgi:hypothetical protein|nr:polysaccharide pyruvyl transferase family protein [Lachnospiraceae bacterium]
MHVLDGIAFYMHAGSGNHGCEAITVSLLRQLAKQDGIPLPVRLVTNSAAEDARYGLSSLDGIVALAQERRIAEHPPVHAAYYAWRRLTGDRESFLRYRLAPITGKDRPRLAVSVGGDNYCYPDMVPDLVLADHMLERQGTATMLLGCSIEPEVLKENTNMRDDMRQYRRIVARESRTYEALYKAGVPEERLVLLPDPAFTLQAADDAPLCERLAKESGGAPLIGLNLSPMAENYAHSKDAVLNGCRQLVRHILEDTDCTVALIPHVVWERSNDRTPLAELYREFRDTGRVLLVPDAPAAELKAVIARCSLFVGARTHATIAAYSSCVPTLVLGYSVKAAGIAEDLFGTDGHYVLPVQQISGDSQITDAFEWLRTNSGGIREKLRAVMPDYLRRAGRNGAEIAGLYRTL